MNVEIKDLDGFISMEYKGRVVLVAQTKEEMTEILLQAINLLSEDNNIEGFGAKPRDSSWDKLRDKVVAQRKKCHCCMTKHNLQVHHIEPFHLSPEKELDENNLVVLCVKCHFLIGHLCNWKSFNPSVVEDAEIIQEKIRNRP